MTNLRTKVFTEQYRTRKWGVLESLSGRGSTLIRTRNLRKGLGDIFNAGTVRSIVDIGCGDFNWMSAMDLSNIDYTGFDIVPELVEENTRKYATFNIRFQLLDIVDEIPPPADLILCRDLFSHLSNEDSMRALGNIRQSRYRYFAASQFGYFLGTKHHEAFAGAANEDIETGQWRRCNMNLRPFYLPLPQFSIPENEILKRLGIWHFDKILLGELAKGDEALRNPHKKEHFLRFAFIQELIRVPGIKTIFLYGSRSRGDHKEYSDIDLFVEIDRHNSEIARKVADIIERADTPLSIDCQLISQDCLRNGVVVLKDHEKTLLYSEKT